MDVMELMFAEWEDGERFSFEDSDRFEEDSLCSFISEAESLCQNWRGWRKQSAGPNSPTVRVKGRRSRAEQHHLWSSAAPAELPKLLFILSLASVVLEAGSLPSKPESRALAAC